MNQVVITGSSGFVGSNLLKDLESNGVIFTPLSLRNLQKAIDLDDAGSIVHLAGKAHDMKKVSEPEEYYRVNYELTKDLYNSFLKSEAKKFIFISSVKASSDHVDDFLNEDDIPNPRTHYGKSKLMAEEYIQSQPVPEGKSWYILRPCMIHGPGNKGNLNLLYKIISNGIPYPLAAFENKRSFLSVENLCFVIKEILTRNDISSGIYNVADDEFLSTNELIELIADASGKKALAWKVNPVVIKYFARLGDILRLPLTTERLNKLTESYMVNNTKILSALGKKLPIGARDGIIKTILSFRELQ